MASAVTLKDLARACGVSRQAVSCALRGDGRLGDETRHRIQLEAQRLGYRPNSIARTMRTGRFGAIALLAGTEARYHRFAPGLWEGIHDELAANDHHLMLARVPESCFATPGAIPKIFREWSVDGVLVNYTPNVFKFVSQHQIPAVWLNTRLERDCVSPADFDAGRMATDHLIARGHRHIAYVNLSPRNGHCSEADRQAGYEAAMQAAGLSPVAANLGVDEETAPEVSRLALARSFIQQAHRPTAVVTYSGWSGEPMLVAALAAGLRVPEDLAIVTIEDYPMESVGLRLTTLVLDAAEMGRVAVRMMLSKIQDENFDAQTVYVPGVLLQGESS